MQTGDSQSPLMRITNYNLIGTITRKKKFFFEDDDYNEGSNGCKNRWFFYFLS